MVELRHLRYAIAAAQSGSFRAAARSLGVQESAVSRRIRDLEDHLGVTLFTRGYGGVELTHAGKRFLCDARKVVDQLSSASMKAAAFGRGEQGSIRVGVLTSLASGFLADLLRTYGRRHPRVDLEIIEDGPHQHVAAVQNGRLDIAFLKGEFVAPGCDYAHFWDERIYVVLPADHKLAGASEVSWRQLHGHDLIATVSNPGPAIREYLTNHLADLGGVLRLEHHDVGRDNLMHLIAIGRGLSLTTESTTALMFPGVTYRPLAGESLPFSGVWMPQNSNPALRRLLSLARTMSKP
jgi:DNA-binding transcriptional LysR family regulator